eukprot:CAMPEP_0176410178 /NCGR_PEP_ID=MMETSP0127-20121128/2914_1 /TAXON_ID=938130 /ORGANISM="Platyophrya macrostoma, Strain WH" /LENGTH=183 /DNA_ID=CAMNT_0017789649 /DNA_START=60 /DNA_END=607 /DNA_ORIENTATION=+
MTTLHPPVNWAQRKDVILVTIPLQDASDVQISLGSGDVFSLSATSAGKNFECKLSLFEKVVPEESTHVVRPRQIELKIKKANVDADYWPRLTKEKVKSSFIQIDWNKWKDEDETAESTSAGGGGDDLGDFGMGGLDMQQMLAQLGGGAGAGGLGGAPGFGSARGQEALSKEAVDNAEDEEMPP